VKAAAAVLGASLLFFLGLLTGAGRREAVPPPTSIPLGVLSPTGAGGTPGAPGTPESPSATRPARAPQSTSSTGKATTTTTAVPMAATGTTTPTGPTASSPPGVPGGAGGTTPNGPAATTPSTARPGQVEQVDNQVDCSTAGQKGKAHDKEACPSTTESTGGPGRGAGR